MKKIISMLSVCLIMASCSGMQPNEAHSQIAKKATKPVINPKNIQKINYDTIANPGVYTGFSKQQEKMLRENGFVVLEPNFDDGAYLKMHSLYERLEYTQGSMLITTDAVLNLWHVFYSESMKAMELLTYLPNLSTISVMMEDRAIKARQKAPKQLQQAYDNVITFFHVGNALLNGSDNWQDWAVASKYQSQLSTAQYAGMFSVAERELALIADQQFSTSPLYGSDYDYSQFKPRGHYATNEMLARYFKAMMWYGLTGFELKKYPIEATLITSFISNDADLLKRWNEIYELTALYSGESDDIMIPQMMQALDSLNIQDINKFLVQKNALAQLEKAMQTLPEPKVVADVKYESNNVNVDKTFKFMGQRFSVDGYILQELMEPDVRAFPTAFDVFTVMGSDTAERVLRQEYRTNQHWPEYDTVLERLKKEYQSGQLTKGDNFYNAWINAIDSVLTYVPQGKAIPQFMTTPAYEYKKLNTALGSYAELKHDNLLYVKQAMAEKGGEGEIDPSMHYLEPNTPLYQRLADLSKKAEVMFKRAGVDNEYTWVLERIQDTLALFPQISEKELNNEPLTKDELITLEIFGGLVDYVSNYYIRALTIDGYVEDAVKTSALIADIATVLGDDGGYVEVAIGLPYEIYALCRVNGVDILAKGVVYSSFELRTNKRLTNADWQKMLGLKADEDGDLLIDTNAKKYAIVRNLYMNYYDKYGSTERNRTQCNEEAEVHWPKLSD